MITIIIIVDIITNNNNNTELFLSFNPLVNQGLINQMWGGG